MPQSSTQAGRAHGVIVLDKPGGMTSAKVVSRVKRALDLKKIGHTGTLDPMATGVLPLCIGEGTKVAGYLLAADKAYEGEILLGVETDTLDREGQVLARFESQARAIEREQLEAAMQQLVGTIEQVPPMFSAIKQGGRRLHELARKGEVVERKARTISVHSFELLSLADCRVRFAVHASKGTYVRSLAFDLGRALGCGAHLSELRRTKSGQFTIEQAISLAELEENAVEPPIVGPAQAIAHLPKRVVPAEQVAAVADGKRLLYSLISDDEVPSEPMALLHPENGGLLAIVEVEEERLRYRRVFNYALTKPS